MTHKLHENKSKHLIETDCNTKRCTCYTDTDSSEHHRHSDREQAEGLTGERCTFFVLKNYPSKAPRRDETNGSFEDPNEGQQGKRECGPMDERRMLAVEDCEERPRDRDRRREVALGSRERICRSCCFEEES